MKMLRDLAKRAGDAMLDITGEKRIEKRAGLFVMRPVLNAKEWNKWAVDFGLPDPIPPGEIHVTIVNSVVDVKMKPDDQVYSFTTDRAFVCLLGLKDDALVVCFESWILWDRHWDFRAAGAVSSFDGYKMHMTLSYNAAGFEISDEALAAMPNMIILGGEVHSGARGAPDPMAETEKTVLVAKSSVSHMLEKGLADRSLSLMEEYALREMGKTGKAYVFKGLELDLEKRLPDPAGKSEVDGAKTVEKEIVLTVRSPTPEMLKSATVANLFKANEDERLVIGWASVSTVKGVLVEDLQGDTITVKAQREFLHDIIRGQRAGKFEHVGKVVNEIVEGIIMDADLQKALGIDLGMEGMLLVTHVPDDVNWEMVKSGDWMYSIAGTVLVLE